MATTTSDNVGQTLDARNPDAQRRRLVDPRVLLLPRSITPDLLAPSVFQPPTPGTAPGYHDDADKQVYENGTADGVAHGDHNHDLTSIRVGSDRTVATADADYVDPISGVVDAVAPPFDDQNRRIVTWDFDTNYPVSPGPTLVFVRFTRDAGTTYTDYLLVGAAPYGQDWLVYLAPPEWDFTDANVAADAKPFLPNHDRTAAFKLVRSKADGKIDINFLPAAVPTTAGVTAAVGAISWKQPCRLATAAALPAYTRTANSITANANGALTVDGVLIAVGDRLLLNHGASGTDNGIWRCTNPGTASVPFAFVRPDAADASAEVISGMAVMVSEGTANADRMFALTTNDPITLNFTSLVFSEIGPKAHHATHESGGADAIKLDDLAAPDDNTDLDVSTSKHGLAPKAPNDATKVLDGTGAYSRRFTPVLKGSDETRTIAGTLAQDGALTFALVANTKYAVRGRIFFDTVAAADFKYDFAGPGSPTLIRFKRSDCGCGGTPAERAIDTAYPGSTSLTDTGGAVIGGYLEFEAIVQNGANAGTFAFRWAQNTADAGNTTVLGCSYLEYLAAP